MFLFKHCEPSSVSSVAPPLSTVALASALNISLCPSFPIPPPKQTCTKAALHSLPLGWTLSTALLASLWLLL